MRVNSPISLSSFVIVIIFSLLLLVLTFSSSSSSSFVDAAEWFTQIICADANCAINCQESKLEEGGCYTTNKGGVTARGYCENAGTTLRQITFPFSNNCSGLSSSNHLVCGQCYPSGMQYISFACPAGRRAQKPISQIRREALSIFYKDQEARHVQAFGFVEKSKNSTTVNNKK